MGRDLNPHGELARRLEFVDLGLPKTSGLDDVGEAQDPNALHATAGSMRTERSGREREASSADVVRGETPVRRVLQGGNLVAYTEIKSPRDDWMDERLAEAATGETVGGLREDPLFKRIRRHVRDSPEQFEAVNPAREHPNIMVLFNHSIMNDYRDLREAVTEEFYAEGGDRFPTMKREADQLVAKNSIDAIAWIDARDRRLEGYLLNVEATPNFFPDPGALRRASRGHRLTHRWDLSSPPSTPLTSAVIARGHPNVRPYRARGPAPGRCEPDRPPICGSAMLSQPNVLPWRFHGLRP
jgi:hypothetical protein